MGDQCPLCGRPVQAESEFCSLHDVALRNLENHYSYWCKAFGGSLTRQEYFDKVQRLSETGHAIKSIIKHFERKETS